eukprot:TRINITY_DN21402_c0_g1_i1.p1 TRINITY_DN21402_c0_g1~~TRINITY_DN21402_c0_g1_i1.p1  ORF type:complete len:322 (+),score=39.68 TRINITY_DN21402_c0_g1_i1:31-966(+)
MPGAQVQKPTGGVRPAAHAGQWYTDDKVRLHRQVTEWMDRAPTVTTKPVKALIAPHAGLSYSGWTAAHAYKHVRLDGIRRIFVMGPSHHEYIPGVAVTSFDRLSTPLGELCVDREVVDALLQQSSKETPFFVMDPEADAEEHSIEMHLPFLAQVLDASPGAFALRKDIRIVPLVVGSLSARQERSFSDVMQPYFERPDTLVFVSSDFCHWGARFRFTYYNPDHGAIHDSVAALDKEGMAIIESQDFDRWQAYLERFRNTICGRHAIGILLSCMNNTAKRHDAKFVHYAQSSQAKTMSDSSVSYAACVITAA